MFFHKVSTQLIKKTFFPFHFVVYLSKEVSVSISRASKKSFYSVLYVGKKPSGSRLTRKFNLHIYLLCWLAAMDNQVLGVFPRLMARLVTCLR